MDTQTHTQTQTGTHTYTGEYQTFKSFNTSLKTRAFYTQRNSGSHLHELTYLGFRHFGGHYTDTFIIWRNILKPAPTFLSLAFTQTQY